MPFGLVFGALFFGGLCTWIGVGLVASGPLSVRLSGAFLVLTGLSLALSLLRRRPWSRWAGAALASLMVVFGFRQALAGDRVLDLVLLLTALVTTALLLLPMQGAVKPVRRRRGVLEAATSVGLCGLLLSGIWTARSERSVPGHTAAGAVPVSSIATRIEWSDFAAGLERARAEGKPLMATFVTDWCPYCKKMDQKTWREPDLIARAADVIPVRVDAEDAAGGQFSGRSLSARYQVQGFPVTLLLDASGGVLSRAEGYRTASQMVRWLDGAIPADRTRPAPTSQTAFR